MFSRLFSQSGLSLERLRALVEVGARGSIARAAENDPARQSLYSRQIKELEDFFQTGLVERQGRGIRLTAAGRELARISRFFLLGLSNFQRGRLAGGQTYRIGASATFLTAILVPALAHTRRAQAGIHFAVEPVAEEDIERRLHDLTLDFGVVSRSELSRPLQLSPLGSVPLNLWVPRGLAKSAGAAAAAFTSGRLPFAWPAAELPPARFELLQRQEPVLECATFLNARQALARGGLAAVLPDFLAPPEEAKHYFRLPPPAGIPDRLTFRLAWNPRLLRLNPHSVRQRDHFIQVLSTGLSPEERS
jgi:DNA-binding transcriptional LysR family regulator